LDGFKAVNDALGHQAGDEVLVEVARRLRATDRPTDLVARLGGDEFAILLADARGRADVDSVVGRVAAAISDPIMVAGRAIVLDCSAGAQLVSDGSSPLDLLRHADIALYAAKRDGRGRLLQFEPEMEEVVRRRLELEAELRVALSSGQIEVVYQPIMDLVDPHVAGFEALARWNHPERGVVGPDEFIPIAEATGLIVPLGRMVMNAACDRIAEWRRLVGHERLLLGVNVSPSQLQDSGFIDDVRTALAASGIPPSALVLEITETVMADPRAVACIHELKHLGLAVALDDFGTGYSSLSYLQQLPIDILKIDKTFIDRIDTNPDRAVLVNSVLRMGRALGLRTVAEGIEDAAQLELLQQLGCQRGQGFYVSAPMPAAAVEPFLSETLAIDRTRSARTGARDVVVMRIPALPTRFALAWTAYASQVVARFEGADDLRGGVSGGMLSVMSHYIAMWRRAAESAGPTFTWEGPERSSVLRLLASDWGRISERAAAGDDAIVAPTDAEPFHNAIANAVLVAIAATEAEPRDDAAHLLHVWLDRHDHQHELASASA
ncbi:MAG: putative bifunctional diguanylate cyclase/phosphodiesterase, partial [Ilumatobacteraceae bacterium]